jgi:hypothetical protein
VCFEGFKGIGDCQECTFLDQETVVRGERHPVLKGAVRTLLRLFQIGFDTNNLGVPKDKCLRATLVITHLIHISDDILTAFHQN